MEGSGLDKKKEEDASGRNTLGTNSWKSILKFPFFL